MNLNQGTTTGSNDLNNIAAFSALSEAEKLSAILNADKIQLNSLITALENDSANADADLLTLAKKVVAIDGNGQLIGGELN
jgi:hypothetical protein